MFCGRVRACVCVFGILLLDPYIMSNHEEHGLKKNKKNGQSKLFSFLFFVAVLYRRVSIGRCCCSLGTTKAVPSCLIFVTATNGVSVCMRVRVCVKSLTQARWAHHTLFLRSSNVPAYLSGSSRSSSSEQYDTSGPHIGSYA